MSISVENFIKTIYVQGKHYEADTKLSTLARLLNITKAAATDMARKLNEKNLVNYIKYKPLTLSPKGNELALNIIRKHRLWETFLHKTLNLSLLEIHREAEHLEHLTSDFLVNKIDSFLDYPSIDPHGDPIPQVEGDIFYNDKHFVLSEARSGCFYKITRLFSSDEDFFHFCSLNQLEIGTIIKVEKQYASKNMTEIHLNDSKILLNKDFTDIIYVEKNGKTESL